MTRPELTRFQPTRTDLNWPELTRTDPNWPELTRIDPNSIQPVLNPIRSNPNITRIIDPTRTDPNYDRVNNSGYVRIGSCLTRTTRNPIGLTRTRFCPPLCVVVHFYTTFRSLTLTLNVLSSLQVIVQVSLFFLHWTTDNGVREIKSLLAKEFHLKGLFFTLIYCLNNLITSCFIYLFLSTWK